MDQIQFNRYLEDCFYKDKLCYTCYFRTKEKIELKKRKRPPYTASNFGRSNYDYYQCPKCKTNSAYTRANLSNHKVNVLHELKDVMG